MGFPRNDHASWLGNRCGRGASEKEDRGALRSLGDSFGGGISVGARGGCRTAVAEREGIGKVEAIRAEGGVRCTGHGSACRGVVRCVLAKGPWEESRSRRVSGSVYPGDGFVSSDRVPHLGAEARVAPVMRAGGSRAGVRHWSVPTCVALVIGSPRAAPGPRSSGVTTFLFAGEVPSGPVYVIGQVSLRSGPRLASSGTFAWGACNGRVSSPRRSD